MIKEMQALAGKFECNIIVNSALPAINFVKRFAMSNGKKKLYRRACEREASKGRT